MWRFYLLLYFIRIDETELLVFIADLSIKWIGIVIPFVLRFIWVELFVWNLDERRGTGGKESSRRPTESRVQQPSGRMRARQCHGPAKDFSLKQAPSGKDLKYADFLVRIQIESILKPQKSTCTMQTRRLAEA